MRHTILIAEDDPSIQMLFSIILKRAGYNVEMSTDGKLLYEKNDQWPSLFILDKQLADTNGLDACRYLKSKEETKNIPVIMISASPGIGDLAKGAGAEDFLEKPFSISALLAKIKKCLKKSGLKPSGGISRISTKSI